jgi:hypothetical protein
MKNETKGLNLPTIKRKDEIAKVKSTSINTIDLKKNGVLDGILKNKNTMQSDNLKREQGLDLVLVGDLTASMIDYHELLKSKFVELCNTLFPLIKNLRIELYFI